MPQEAIPGCRSPVTQIENDVKQNVEFLMQGEIVKLKLRIPFHERLSCYGSTLRNQRSFQGR